MRISCEWNRMRIARGLPAAPIRTRPQRDRSTDRTDEIKQTADTLANRSLQINWHLCTEFEWLMFLHEYLSSRPLLSILQNPVSAVVSRWRSGERIIMIVWRARLRASCRPPRREEGREGVEPQRDVQQAVEPEHQREELADAAEDDAADVGAEVDVGLAAVAERGREDDAGEGDRREGQGSTRGRSWCAGGSDRKVLSGTHGVEQAGRANRRT